MVYNGIIHRKGGASAPASEFLCYAEEIMTKYFHFESFRNVLSLEETMVPIL